MIKITEFNFDTQRDMGTYDGIFAASDFRLTSTKIKFRFPKLKDRLIFIFKCLTQYEIEESGSFMEKAPLLDIKKDMFNDL